MRSPVGVAGLISPWNLPLYLLTFKIAPALMAGCTVVCKPSEMTTVTTWMLCKVSMISFKVLGGYLRILRKNFFCEENPVKKQKLV